MTYGTVKFYSCSDQLLHEKVYWKKETRDLYIQKYCKKNKVCYYDIIPNFIKWKYKEEEPLSEVKKIVRPPAVYTNLKTNYLESNS
jgi:hypothetical protein